MTAARRLLALAAAAHALAAEPAIPTLEQLRQRVPAAAPVIARVAFVSTTSARPRGQLPPKDWDAPDDVAVASPIDLEYTLALNDVSGVKADQWPNIVAAVTNAALLVAPSAPEGGSWTLTVPGGPTQVCAPKPPSGGRPRFAACLGYDGVVVAVQDNWYLVHSYRHDLRRGAQALLLKDSAAAALLSGAPSGDGLVNVLEVGGALALVKGITRSSQPVVVGTKVIFESGGPE